MSKPNEEQVKHKLLNDEDYKEKTKNLLLAMAREGLPKPQPDTELGIAFRLLIGEEEISDEIIPFDIDMSEVTQCQNNLCPHENCQCNSNLYYEHPLNKDQTEISFWHYHGEKIAIIKHNGIEFVMSKSVMDTCIENGWDKNK